MYSFEALLLGVVQGLSEFLPISSSAHLTLVPKIMDWKAPLLNSLAFDVALHFGTLIAVVTYFRNDIASITKSFFLGLYKRQPFVYPEAKLAWFILFGTIPAVVVALLFKNQIETIFRNPLLVAIMLILFGLIMGLAERIAVKHKSVSAMQWKDALLIGCAQALALMPGVSRSGSTITVGLLLNYKREEAARFSFLLGIPAIIGATVFAFRDMLHLAFDQSWIIMILGTMAAAISGYACIKYLLLFLQKRSLYIFVWYRVILGLAVLAWIWYGK